MNPEMDTSEMRVLLQGVAKIFEAGLKSKTWDIHGMPQFITTTHREGCETCDVYASHVVKALEASTVEIPSREVEKAFQIAWLNIGHHVEDEASSVGCIYAPYKVNPNIFAAPCSSTLVSLVSISGFIF